MTEVVGGELVDDVAWQSPSLVDVRAVANGFI